ncbi:1,4-alpha-glucan branching enzyme [Pontibacter ummariensis]|uniref:1,4-alpha-glucan branching enzyme GlgB n=1 Tax=Pontibacter ummariensis TaxID=1610492 RepID=A0A239IMW6_9BACT|nr:1,4-alpha-glucan branching protein GlgB [Pontibacter ummariensis]PRY09731.1 1,4-alpha-glucan branching enzyme [Pontibacter ummariensis]SNS94881.1 1,4-alpha-glucan branching enzyme [Pontibacter ummariensis]
MAKKKESTTTDEATGKKAAKKAAPAKKSTKGDEPMAAKDAKAEAAAGDKPTARRGRSKATDTTPAAEMGSPVTEAGAGEDKPKKRGRPKKSEAETPDQPKRGRPKKGDVHAEETEVVAPIASSDNVQEYIKVNARGQGNVAQPSGEPAELDNNGVYKASLLTDFDIYLFKEGRHYSLYEKLGAHKMEYAGKEGICFAVWAPNAESVSLIGDFNGWNRESHQLLQRDDGSGIWEGFIPDVPEGMLYKYHIKSRYHLYHVEKSDPFAFSREAPPQTASVVAELNYEWQDQEWLQQRKSLASQPQPYSVYELHLGSWRRKIEDNNRPLTYRELAEELPAYVRDMGFTHVELMPIMFHPFAGSWGYQVTGYFAPASTFGSPQDLMHLIDVLHQHGIGVILDWVPSHFPSDEHGLAYFDGTHLFEHADPRKGFHPDWNSYIFNYGRNEVRSFLISNALFWLDKYHADGLRVDAVASMLYLDYSRKEGEWIPNEYGGRENLEAISFLKDFNKAVHDKFPDVRTVAEESTAWPGVTNSIENGGLGFNMKWMMGWMHDTLDYFSKDPVYRRYHQGEITFSMMYAFSEKFMLPLSHDEVVHGKGSLLQKMPGDDWQRFANLRTLYAYMYAHPGGKLLFMGAELAQGGEWNHDSSLDWHLLQYGFHQGVQDELRELNAIYKNEPALYEHSFDPQGFEWVDYNDAHNSVISFLRKGNRPEEQILVVCNFTPVVHEHYRLGVPHDGEWIQIFNSDDGRYGGSNVHNTEPLFAVPEPFHGRSNSLILKVPPLAVVYFKYRPGMRQ